MKRLAVFTVSGAAPEITLIAGALIGLAAEHGAPNGFQCWEVAERTGLSRLVVGRFASQRINELQIEVTRRDGTLHLAGYESTRGFKQRMFRLIIWRRRADGPQAPNVADVLADLQTRVSAAVSNYYVALTRYLMPKPKLEPPDPSSLMWWPSW